MEKKPTIDDLNEIYYWRTNKIENGVPVTLPIEGFVVTNDNQSFVRKYVRLKGKKLENHHT